MTHYMQAAGPSPLRLRRTPVNQHTVASAPFSARPPSPPSIHVPSIFLESDHGMSIVPSFEEVDGSELTKEDLQLITQNRTQIANDSMSHWKYESRRQAQPILDFLYLGPSSIGRDKDFLRREGITMLLGVRNTGMAGARLMNMERTANELGIVADYIDSASHQELIHAIPTAVKKINDHLLSVYRSQAKQPAADHQLSEGQIAIDGSTFRRGKVLVFCETGNDRSAIVVAAYIMAVYNADLVSAVQFINLQRFCTNFDDTAKNWLQSYEMILQAKRMVLREAQFSAGRNMASLSSHTKRSIADTMEEDTAIANLVSNPALADDLARFADRDRFVPFKDRDVDMG